MTQDLSQLSMLERIAAQTQQAAPVEKPIVQVEASQDWRIPGFGAGARVETSFGHVPIEALRKRDPVRTSDGRFVKVQFVDEIRLDRRFLLTHPEAQPITIPKDVLAPLSPNRDIRVSGAQVIKTPGRMDQANGKSAQDLIGQRRIRRELAGYFTYYVFHCGEPCTVSIDGMWFDIVPSTPDISEE